MLCVKSLYYNVLSAGSDYGRLSTAMYLIYVCYSIGLGVSLFLFDPPAQLPPVLVLIIKRVLESKFVLRP